MLERAQKFLRRFEVLPFVAPGLVLLCLFVLWPLLQGLRISFYDWSIMPGAEQKFVGLANYSRAFHDPVARTALVNTLIYVVVTVPGQMFFGLLVALGLNAAIRGRVLLRSLYYIPVLTSWVVVSFIFKYLFMGGEAGPVNYLLQNVLGILEEPVGWLQDRWTAQVPITTLGIWKGIGWNMIMFLAALQSIPREIYEAAAIDGASRFQVLWRITLPLIRPVLLFVMVMLTIGGFSVFISVNLLTGGGPMDSTQVILSYMYDQGFKYFEFGYGFALAALLGLVIFAISRLQFRYMKNEIDM
ncbi:MAG TPA: sugar ABC transporter permease [Clostridiales bacterium]|nr:sugar ABC transporter permease [Clostridiales bacterium]